MSVKDVLKKSFLESDMFNQAISTSTILTIVIDLAVALVMGLLIYYIYKLDSGDYYLEYKDSKNSITNETETIELDITNNNFSKIKLTLETNLTIKNEY